MSEIKNFKCPNCDGALEFDSKTQKLKCPYCQGTFDPESFDKGKDFVVENDTYQNEKGLMVYTCKSCGGSIIADEQTAATSCPYCGSNIVLTSNLSGNYKPSRIIPFKLNKKEAKEQYRKHLVGKILLPKAFVGDAIMDEIKGVYVPYWLFDGKANAKIWYNASKIRTWSDGNYNYTETSFYKLFRSGNVNFSAVPVDASSKIADDISESIEPYNPKELIEFKDNYLAGYMADKYDVEAAESKKIANERIANSTFNMFTSTTAGYINCVPSSSQINISEGKQEYVLFPVWLLNVKYQNKMYTFAMNGQTGKFVGDLPMDKGILLRTLLGVFVIAFIVISVIQYFV